MLIVVEKSECKYCNFIVLSSYYFCPNCGKKLHEPPLSTSISKQIGVYALSFFLPPLGLLPAIKYITQKSQKAKIVGIVAIILTVVSIIITINVISAFLSAPLGLDSKQMQELQNLGY